MSSLLYDLLSSKSQQIEVVEFDLIGSGNTFPFPTSGTLLIYNSFLLAYALSRNNYFAGSVSSDCRAYFLIVNHTSVVPSVVRTFCVVAEASAVVVLTAAKRLQTVVPRG